MFSSRRQSFFFAYSAKTLLLTIFIAILLRALVVTSYVVQTDAMNPAVRKGEFLLGWRAFEARRGDVVLLACPESEAGVCIKRVVGVAGDRVEIAKQRLILNAQPATYEKIPESADGALVLREASAAGKYAIAVDTETPAAMAPVVVPPGQVFLLNDNRGDASDSRKWGPVPVLQLEARAWRIWMSVDWSKNRLNWPRLGRLVD